MSAGGKCEGKGARISTAVCLPSLRPQDQVELVQTVGPFPGTDKIYSCFSYECVKTLTSNIHETTLFELVLINIHHLTGVKR